MWNKIIIKSILCCNLYVSCYSVYSKLKCNFIKMSLRDKCSPVNLLHFFGTPILKYTSGGLLEGGMVSMSTFLTWIHVYFISFDWLRLFSANACFISIYFHKILMLTNTMICSPECVAVFVRPWLEYRTSSMLLCSHGAYSLNRVCTGKIFSRFVILSRLALSIIIFLRMLILALFLFCKNVFFYFCRSLILLKGYLRYKTRTSQNVSSEALVKNFFIS